MKGLAAIACLLCLLLPLACSPSDEEQRAEAPNASARSEAAQSKPYVASVLREPFHRSDCRWAQKIDERNLVGYDSREAAIKDGHRPCKVCGP